MSILECKVSLPEIKDFIKDLVLVPENIFKLIKRDITDPIGKFLTKMMEAELTFLGRQKYEKIKGKREKNYRNGYTTTT
ncbi:hypothetical protein JCM12298_09500 [Desulfothermus naphthae]